MTIPVFNFTYYIFHLKVLKNYFFYFFSLYLIIFVLIDHLLMIHIVNFTL